MLVKLAFAMQKLKKISEKIFVMINKVGGGGKFLDSMGGHSCYEGGHRVHGGPPTRENPAPLFSETKGNQKLRGLTIC